MMKDGTVSPRIKTTIQFIVNLQFAALFGWLWHKGFHATVIGAIVFFLGQLEVKIRNGLETN